MNFDNVKLLVYGSSHCGKSWQVTESTPCFFNRIYYIYSGSATYRDATRCVTLKPGNIYIFPSSRPYSLSHDPSHPLFCLWFHVELHPFMTNSLISHYPEPELLSLLKACSCIMKSGEGLSNVLELLILPMLSLVNLTTPFVRVPDERLEKCIGYIHSNYRRPISNDELASLMGVSRYYFIKLFKKLLGSTPQAYIQSLRMNSAVRLLSRGYLVEEVADMVGYADAKAFSRSFKKVKGLSPSTLKDNPNVIS